MSKAMDTSTCKRPCVYLDTMDCCNYYLDTGMRRPCPAGAGCTVRVAKNRKSDWYTKKKPRWDVEKARRLRKEGWSWPRIAKEVGAGESTVWSYFKSHGV